MSGIILLMSIVLFVLLGMVNPENHIFVHNSIFNYLLYNILIVPTKLSGSPTSRPI